MRRTIVGVILITLCACTAELDDDVRAQSASIVGGSEAVPGAWPWQVQMAVPGFSHWCGAVLLSEEWVLTAAHCVEGVSASGVTLRFGLHDQTSPGTDVQTRSVESIEIHPDYGYIGGIVPEYDLALMRLSNPVGFSQVVQPVLVSAAPAPEGAPAFVTGWGRTGAGLPGSDVLLQAPMPVRSAEECNQAGTLAGPVTDAMVCAGHLEGEHGGCHGDSGGPLVIPHGFSGGWRLIGVVSWGVGHWCSSYTVFSSVSGELSDWIHGFVGNPPVIGDVTGDGCVDEADYNYVVQNYGTPPAVDPICDLNGDGGVDYLDVTIVLQNWGEGC